MSAMLQMLSRRYACALRSRVYFRSRVTSARAINQLRAVDGLQKHWASTQHEPLSQGTYGLSNVPVPHQKLEPAGENVTPQSIRDRLRLWKPEAGQNTYASMPPDMVMFGNITNSLSRTQSTGSSEMDQLRPQDGMTQDSEESLANQDADVAVVGVGTRCPGDLVELRQTGSRVPLFAIYLGHFGDRNHFYAVNGRWITSMGFSPLFIVAGFATTAELAPILARMPLKGTPEQFDEMRRNEEGPSRVDGAGLIERMTEFRLQSETVYQGSLDKLDTVRTLLLNQRQVTYLSLAEVADVLLPSSLKVDSEFPSFALYAVHTALHRNEIGFRPLSPFIDCHRPENILEVLPPHYTYVVSKVTTMVRDYTETNAKRLRPPTPKELEETLLGKFILQARKAVLASREEREWTSHGILKPSSATRSPEPGWPQSSEQVISFLEWWASYDIFEAGSRFHSYGALILRSLQLYDGAVLDQSTAWTFLQEIGSIPSWEIPSRYKVRFPGVTIARGGGLLRESPKDLETSKRPDIAADARRKFAKDTIFCIDAASTIVVDDGVSLERTDKHNEFWIHIHVADPASSIMPNSELCQYMELIPENIYLPGHFQAMLPSDLGHDEAKDFTSEGLVSQFSLKSGGKALTFSAKVNDGGDLLDFKVEPSMLGKVLYLDPKDVSSFCNEPDPPPVPNHSLVVGTPNENTRPIPNREMVFTKDLEDSSKDDISVLYRLVEAIRNKRLDKGAWPYFFPRPSVEVSFQPVTENSQEKSPLSFAPDPYIKATYEASTGCSVVSNSMVLAGEIAARWCSSRGIPIPYRRDAMSTSGLKGAFEYATQEIYPLIKKGIEPSNGQRQELAKRTGGIELSTRPGTYFILGLDMYAKATSPLRRFSDLIVHWQIHAALWHERQTNRPVDPELDNLDDILPFSSTKLFEMLPLLQMREKMARTVSRGVLEWILIALVRAWRFENTAPLTFCFTVGSRWRQGCIGKVDFFDLNAVMDIEGLDRKALIKDVQVGDQFEVELADVNVHSRQVLVRALRYLGHGRGSGEAAAAAELSTLSAQS